MADVNPSCSSSMTTSRCANRWNCSSSRPAGSRRRSGRGSEFLSRPRGLAPSCLVLDVVLPDLDGSTCRRSSPIGPTCRSSSSRATATCL